MQGLFCMTPETAVAVGRGGWQFFGYSFSFVDLTGGSAAPLDVVDPSFSFLTELPGTRVLLGSCNGLVLFQLCREPQGGRMGYVVCNPTTKEWEAVPACGDPEHPLTYAFLAFDPAVSPRFHLVQFQVEDDEEFISVHAYSSETKTWGGNQIDELGEQGEGWRQVTTFLLGDPNPPCPFIHGFLHYLVVLDQRQMKIAVVDVQGRVRRMIPVPHVPARGHFMCYFGESQGQLHYMSQQVLLDDGEGKYNLSVWALQDYDAQEWVLKVTANTYEVFGEDSCLDATSEFDVVDIHQDCNVVFFTHPLVPSNLVAYDMDSKEVRVIATFGDGKHLFATARYVPCRFC